MYKMITPKEALQIYEEAGWSTIKTLEKMNFNGQIMSAALSGERKFTFHLRAESENSDIVPNAAEHLVIQKMKEAGFNVFFGFYDEHYIPRSQPSDSEVWHRNVGYTVSW